MSAYFQRLIAQSGLHIRQSPLEPPSVVDLSVQLEVPSVEPLPSVELIEVHEERLSETLPAPGQAATHTTTASSAASAPPRDSYPTPSPIPPAIRETRRLSDSPAIREAATSIEETVMLASTRQSPTPTPSVAIHPAQATSFAPDTRATRSARPPPEALPADVMQAVMNWIAAGETPPPNKAESSPPVSVSPAALSSSEVKSISPSATPPSRSQAPVEITERVMRTLEERLESPPPPEPEAVSAAPEAAPDTDERAPSMRPPADAPVRVSIGSIHLRVEAPAPEPAPARTVHPPGPARPVSSFRANGFSKLRRHYILPH